MNLMPRMLAAVLVAASAPSLVAPATAAPIASPPGLHAAAAPPVEAVQYRRGWRGGHRGGGFVGAGVGLAAGAIIGGAMLGATRPYGYGGYRGYDSGYAYGPSYGPGDDEGYVAVSPAGGGEFAYCQQRFRSYDPASGTYLGFDGMRHPCP
jgi:hypothetical protein